MEQTFTIDAKKIFGDSLSLEAPTRDKDGRTIEWPLDTLLSRWAITARLGVSDEIAERLCDYIDAKTDADALAEVAGNFECKAFQGDHYDIEIDGYEVDRNYLRPTTCTIGIEHHEELKEADVPKFLRKWIDRDDIAAQFTAYFKQQIKDDTAAVELTERYDGVEKWLNVWSSFDKEDNHDFSDHELWQSEIYSRILSRHTGWEWRGFVSTSTPDLLNLCIWGCREGNYDKFMQSLGLTGDPATDISNIKAAPAAADPTPTIDFNTTTSNAASGGSKTTESNPTPMAQTANTTNTTTALEYAECYPSAANGCTDQTLIEMAPRRLKMAIAIDAFRCNPLWKREGNIISVTSTEEDGTTWYASDDIKNGGKKVIVTDPDGTTYRFKSLGKLTDYLAGTIALEDALASKSTRKADTKPSATTQTETAPTETHMIPGVHDLRVFDTGDGILAIYRTDTEERGIVYNTETHDRYMEQPIGYATTLQNIIDESGVTELTLPDWIVRDLSPKKAPNRTADTKTDTAALAQRKAEQERKEQEAAAAKAEQERKDAEAQAEAKAEAERKEQERKEQEAKAEADRKAKEEADRKRRESMTVRHEAFDDIKFMVDHEVKAKRAPYIYGPAGTGKTYLAQQVLEECGLEVVMLNAIQDVIDVAGFIDAYGNYHGTPAYDAVVNGKGLVVDEFDRGRREPIAWLNALLANRIGTFPVKNEQTGVTETRTIIAHENFRIIACGNTLCTGADEMYSSAEQLDAATMDRFNFIEVGYDSRLELSMCGGDKELVEFIDGFRKAAEECRFNHLCSYRALEGIHLYVADGMTVEKAIDYCLLKGMKPSDQKSLANNLAIYGKNRYADAFRKMAADAKTNRKTA